MQPTATAPHLDFTSLICAMRRTVGGSCSVFSWCFPGERRYGGKPLTGYSDRGPISNPTDVRLLSQGCGGFYGSKRRSAQLNWRCVRSWETGTRHWEGIMKIHRMAQVAFVALLLLMGFTRACFAETGTVSVVFTKGGFIVDVGGGQGVLTFRGKRYPFTVSGMSLGLQIGASTSKFVGMGTELAEPRRSCRQLCRRRRRRCDRRRELGPCSCRTPTASSCPSAVPGSVLSCRLPWAG